MSSGARVLQLLFVMFGLLFVGLGLLGVVTSGGEQKSSAEWTCKPAASSPTTSTCTSVGGSDGNLEQAIGFVLVGIAFEATAAAIAAGSRSPAAVAPAAVPAYPTMPPGYPAPMPPGPAYPPQPQRGPNP